MGILTFILILFSIWWVIESSKNLKVRVEYLEKSLALNKQILHENKFNTKRDLNISFIGDRFAVVDVETTGLKSATSNIIQISIIIYENKKKVLVINEYINPGVGIPDNITKINRITNDMVKDKKPFSAHAYNIKYWLTKYKVIGHNLRFDAKMIENEFSRLGEKTNINWGFCTMSFETERPDLNSKPKKFIKLINLADELKIKPIGKLHDAYTDADLTGRIAISLYEKSELKYKRELSDEIDRLNGFIKKEEEEIKKIKSKWNYNL